MIERSVRRLVAAIVALTAGVTSGLVDAGSRPTLESRLGQVLRDLDRDQTRQVSRTGGGESAFAKISADQLWTVLSDADRPSYVVVGRRGPGAEGPLELRRIVRVQDGATQAALPAASAATLRDAVAKTPAYSARAAATAAWSELAVLLQARAARAGGVEAANRDQAVALLASASREVRYVVRLESPDAGSASIDRLIVLPDSVRITIGPGSGPASRSALGSDTGAGRDAETEAEPERDEAASLVVGRPPGRATVSRQDAEAAGEDFPGPGVVLPPPDRE